MFGSHVPEIVIGLVFIYLLLSIICSAANEMIAAVLALRARNLSKGIESLLADNQVKGLAELFYEHPLIKSLYKGNRKPSYILPRAFVRAFLDGVAPVTTQGTDMLSEITAAVNGLPPDSSLKRILQVFLKNSGNDLKNSRPIWKPGLTNRWTGFRDGTSENHR